MEVDETLGETASARFAAEALEVVTSAIRQAGGREVFFAGALDKAGIVRTVRVLARGTEGAVPAITHDLEKGDVVIHNHPSGHIAPSEADLQLSTIFGFQGHGVYIVDNACARVYVVVEPLRDKPHALLDVDGLVRDLNPAGTLARSVPRFEFRPQQLDMMRHAARAFNEDGIGVVEAPTGVGKTFAYLLPAAHWAIQNKERVVVSTRTINLQEQIIQKDLPVIQTCLERPCSAVLVKGRSNYLCWRKLNRFMSESSLMEGETDKETMEALLAWARKTEDGSLSDLPFVPPRELWEEVCSEADTCRINQCPNSRQCFVGKARREVAKADLLVVNHHMLFSDLSVKRELGQFNGVGVLPAYSRVVIDEAHSVEESATEYFGAEATRNGAMSLIGRFIRVERGRERGLLPMLKMKIMRETHLVSFSEQTDFFNLIDNTLLPLLSALREGLSAAFQSLRNLTSERCKQLGRDVKWRLTEEVLKDPELREIHVVYVQPLVEEIQECALNVGKIAERVKAIPKPEVGESPFLTELFQLEAYRDRLVRLAHVLAEGTSERLERNTVRWIEIDSSNKNIVRIVRCPLDVGEPLAEWVWSNLRSAVLTSATLSIRKEFQYFQGRVGLDKVCERHVEPLALGSPFDFEHQALLCVPTDLVPPDAPGFLDETVSCVRETLDITRGHAFVLFTSFYAMDYVYSKLERELKAGGITPLKQGQMARTPLLERFRSDASSVLFGTDSFWEGVDVAGDALQCVIVPKLPFRVPTEPIQEARAEAIERAGGNAFMGYTVPQAVIKFRQGFGRLIRRRSDRGAVIVLDRRIMTKYYGRMFLESLPAMRVVSGPRHGVFMALRTFFHPSEGD